MQRLCTQDDVGVDARGALAALREALAILLPVACAGCGEPDHSLCPGCVAELRVAVHTREFDGVPAFAALEYAGAVKAAILALKTQGRTDVARELARPLASLLERVVLAVDDGSGPRLATLPPSTAAKRSRGFDPVTVLLAGAGLRPAVVLRRARSAATQKTLTVEARERNIHGSLAARTGLVGRSFIIVDDVVTTGSSAREAIRAIEAAGGTVLAVVALAATPRLDGSEASRWVRLS